MKRVDVDTDSSEFSTSTTSNITLPHLEATDAERALDDNKRRKRKEAIKLKREARARKKGGATVREKEAKERRKKA